MYQIQIQFNKTGKWENTVYHPMSEKKAVKLIESTTFFNHDHNYRIVEA